VWESDFKTIAYPMLNYYSIQNTTSLYVPNGNWVYDKDLMGQFSRFAIIYRVSKGYWRLLKRLFRTKKAESEIKRARATALGIPKVFRKLIFPRRRLNPLLSLILADCYSIREGCQEVVGMSIWIMQHMIRGANCEPATLA